MVHSDADESCFLEISFLNSFAIRQIWPFSFSALSVCCVSVEAAVSGGATHVTCVRSAALVVRCRLFPPPLCGLGARSSHTERIGSKRLSLLPLPFGAAAAAHPTLHCLCAVPIRTLHSRNHCAPTPRTPLTHHHHSSSSSHERHRSRGQSAVCTAIAASPRCRWTSGVAARLFMPPLCA